MDKPTCYMPTCEKPVLARGLCTLHYQRWLKYGTPNYVGVHGPDPKPVRKPSPKPCSVEGCSLPHNAKGYCTTHAYRAKHGIPLTETRRMRRYPEGATCTVEGCSDQPLARWLCSRHYDFYKEYGDPDHRKAGEVRDGKRVCARCGRDLPVGTFQGTYCVDCAREYAREAHRLKTFLVEQRVCKVCGHLYHSANTTKVTCSKVCSRINTRNTATSVDSRRRARLAGRASEKFTHLEIFERDGWECGICGEPVDPDLKFPDPGFASLDHIIPIARGGDHTRSNVQLAHFRCNVSKGTRIL